MGQTGRQPRPLIALTGAAILATLLLAGVAQRAWALPGRVPPGQTIPPPPTATHTSMATVQPTATWTPRPTWTPVATQPSVTPAATATPGAGLPTATAPGPVVEATRTAARVTSPSPTSAAPRPTLELPGTPSPSLPTAEIPAATLFPTPLPVRPIPLAFEVAVAPQVAGPRDVVQFVLQVANVGYGPVDSVQVDAVFDHDLLMQSVDCPRCTADCSLCQGGTGPARLSLFIGLLRAGEQVIAPVHVQVAEGAWPGQSQRTDWTLTATGLPAQTVQAEVVLPWAQLPATGGR